MRILKVAGKGGGEGRGEGWAGASRSLFAIKRIAPQSIRTAPGGRKGREELTDQILSTPLPNANRVAREAVHGRCEAGRIMHDVARPPERVAPIPFPWREGVNARRDPGPRHMVMLPPSKGTMMLPAPEGLGMSRFSDLLVEDDREICA